MISLRQIGLIDLIPPNLRHDPAIAAAAESLDRQLKAVTDLIPGVSILHRINALPEDWLDALAWQWRAPFYDQSLPIDQKRELVSKALAWHKRKGTPSAVEELVTTVFGSGVVLEWYQYGGQPGCFKIVTNDPSATTDKAAELLAAINSVKNVRSWLESIEVITEGSARITMGFAAHIGKRLTARQVV